MSQSLRDVVQQAKDKRHNIVDHDPDAMVAEGVFAYCTKCKANLRYYHGRGMGEAYMVYCPILDEGEQQSEPVFPDTIEAEWRPMLFNDWRDTLMAYAREKGWATKPEDISIGELVALMHSELSELLEEYRNGHGPTDTYYTAEKPGKPEGIPSELADIIIRALQFAGIFGIDVDDIVQRKHDYNMTREYRHGGKRL